MLCIAFVLSFLFAAATTSSVNYCGARMCGNTNAHTFCQFPEGPSPDCVGYISARLTVEEKSRIIARLNRRRNEAATGRMRGLPTAGNMLKLRWVEELAREAQRWADQCRPPRTLEEHDDCRDLYSLTVGQCVASVVGEAPGLRVESMVDIWYMQSMLYKGNVTFYMPSSENGSFYGDFAQIMWARSYMVGCGRSRFMTPWQGRLRSVERLVCNIAPYGPTPSRPLWAPAAPAASCPPRSVIDAQMPALCDYQREPNEIVYIDPSITVEEQLLLNTVLEIEANKTIDYEGSLDQIYLTKLAIATIENTITTETYSNSVQRRDVVELIDLTDGTNSKDSILVDVTPLSSSTTSPYTEITESKMIKVNSKKKINFIGRPRTYNVEDLTDVQEKTENNTPNEEMPKKEKEFYAEYEFVEQMDENSTDLEFNATGVDVTSIENVNEEVEKEVVTRLYQNSSMLYAGPVNTVNYNDSTAISSPSDSYSENRSNTQNTGNVSFIMKDNIEDYLSDPETVRELQEALERVEHEMAPREEKATNQGKVRRELRNFPDEKEHQPKIDRDLAERQLADRQLADRLYNAEVERNKSLERGPMYNMVLKYMPYLKQYEGGLLSGSDDGTSRASVVTPTYFVLLVLTFCL